MRNVYATIILCFLAIVTPAKADTTSTFILPSGVEVKIVEATLKKSLFKIEGCSDKDSVCRINGHVPFGISFGLPKTYVRKISISFKERSYLLDVSNMYNAWGSRPLEYPGKIRYFGGKCSDINNCQIRGLFSDGAGSFVAEWRIVNGRQVRTVLTDSNDIVNLFMEHIDPPEFD
jgi:hypothetical protein